MIEKAVLHLQALAIRTSPHRESGAASGQTILLRRLAALACAAELGK